MPLDTTGLRQLDAGGLEPLDSSGLTQLDTSGLTPLSGAPPGTQMDAFDALDIGGRVVTTPGARAKDKEVDPLRSAFGSFSQGFGTIVSGLPKSVALMTAPDSDIFKNFDRIDNDRPPLHTEPIYDPGGMLIDDPLAFFYDEYKAADEAGKQAIRAEFQQKGREVMQSTMYKAGNSVDEWFVDNFPTDPDLQESFWASKVPQGLGSATGFVIAALASRGALGTTPVATYGAPAMLGSQVNRVDQFEQALNSGSDIGTALQASELGAIIGTFEAFPVGNLFNRLDKVSGGQVKKWLIRAVTQGTEEAVQESLSGIMNAAVAQKLYDPEAGIWTMERVEEGGVGFVTGAILETLFTLAMPGRRRGSASAPSDGAKSTTEVTDFANERMEALNLKADQAELTDEEQGELEFLREHGNNAQVVGAAYNVRVEPTANDAVQQEMDALTDEDRASPIPDELIAEGRAVSEGNIPNQEKEDATQIRGDEKQVQGTGALDELSQDQGGADLQQPAQAESSASDGARQEDDGGRGAEEATTGAQDAGAGLDATGLIPAEEEAQRVAEPVEDAASLLDVPEGWRFERGEGGQVELLSPTNEAVYSFAIEDAGKRQNRINREVKDWSRNQTEIQMPLEDQQAEAQKRADKGYADLSNYAEHMTIEEQDNLKEALFERALAGLQHDLPAITRTAEKVRLALNSMSAAEQTDAASDITDEQLNDPAAIWKGELTESGRMDLLDHAYGDGVRRGDFAKADWQHLSPHVQEKIAKALPTFEVGGVTLYAPEPEAVSGPGAPESAAATTAPAPEPLAETPETVQEASEGIDAAIQERGEPILSRQDAEQRWSNGETIYAFNEMDERPSLVTSIETLRANVVDQLVALPAKAPESAAATTTPAPEQPAETPETVQEASEGAAEDAETATAQHDNDKMQEKPAAKPAETEAPLRIEDYTAKSIIIKGQTKENIDRIKGAIPGVRALWNRKNKGWVFAKKREDEVREALKDLLTTGKAEKKPLYANRPVTNAADIVAWASEQGFKTTLPANEMHATVAYSKEPMDATLVNETSEAATASTGSRSVEQLGDEGAVVLRFESADLQKRWREYQEAGASWDFEGYKPHITITYDAGSVDLSKVEPYEGPINFGAEVQEPIKENAQDDITETPTTTQPAGTMFVQWGNRKAEVESFEEAARKWGMFRDATNLGARDLPRASIVDASGKKLADIMYNGKIKPVEAQKPATPQVPAIEGMAPLGAAGPKVIINELNMTDERRKQDLEDMQRADTRPTIREEFEATPGEELREEGAPPNELRAAPDDGKLFDMALASINADRGVEVFPAPDAGEYINYETRLKGEPYLTTEEAQARLDAWKDIAGQVGDNADNSRKIIISLFDESGVWSDPWARAGYTVIQMDKAFGHDIIGDMRTVSPNGWIADIEAAVGGRTEGILAACPCTSFAGSGARWWHDQHDQPNKEMVRKKYGETAADMFDRPIDYATMLVDTTKLYIEMAGPRFHVLENPVGRIAEKAELPQALALFNPNNFGDPYTKKTMLWGDFENDMPTANVDPVEGSKIQQKLSSGDARRSLTPEGFAYSFFIANEPEAARIWAQKEQQSVTLGANQEAQSGIQRTIPPSDARTGAEDVQPTASDGGSKRPRGQEIEGSAAAVQGPDSGRTDASQRIPERAARERGRGSSTRATDRISEREPGTERSVREDSRRVKGQNFRIEPGALAEERGRVQKAKDNLKAIKLMRDIEASGRPATRGEQIHLARYAGWGGIKGVFPNTEGKFEKGFESVGKELKGLLTETEYATARRSLQYAHYTAENVVNAMWTAAQGMGFNGGHVFEPGMGVGNFAGLMPADVAERTEYSGLELDHTTARIARLLYPHWGVRQDDFTKAPLPKDTFDLVIGNPPFADINIKSDAAYPQGFLLHDYFFAKSLDSVRPGGLLAFVTSAGTMNKKDTKAREYFADRADLVGAIRLPGTAFKQTANTEVTTDVLFFRKRMPDESAKNTKQWVDTVEVTLPTKEGGKKKGLVNRYFHENPDMVLGEEGFFDTLYPGRYAVRAAKGFDLDAALNTAIGQLPQNVMTEWADAADRAEIDFSTAEHKDGSFYVAKDGSLMQQAEGVGGPVRRRGAGVKGGKTKAEIERIRALVPVRDALRAVYAANIADDTANADKARQRLNRSYDAFVKKFGAINKAKFQYRRPTVIQQESARAAAREEARYVGKDWREGSFNATSMIEKGASLAKVAKARKAARERLGEAFDEGSFNPADMPDIVIDKRPNIDGFMDDPESYRLRAIEKYNDQSDEAAKSAVFFENIITRERAPEINSVNDALLHVLNKRGRVEIDEIAHASKLTPSETIEKLGDSIFRKPGTQDSWALRDEYLSGNVRRKLRQARAAAQRDQSLQRNVDALEAAQPAPLPPSEISANLGMPWIPTNIIESFGTDGLGLAGLKVQYLPALATWTVRGDTTTAAAKSTWGTADMSAPELIQHALNRQDPRIYRHIMVDGRKSRELDTVATEAAQDKAKQIREQFSDWVWSDDARSQELSDLYNEEYNSLVVREYDGSYLTTPGLSSAWSWRPHQTRVIARIIQDGNTYMGHGVGAGKTSAMIGAGMEMRRLGLVRKPMYSVPNHMLAQFTKEFYEQYPTARIAVADERRFHTSRRKQFIANVANEDLDAIIITHSAFGMIPISEEFQDGLVQEQIDQYREILNEVDSDQENRITRGRLEKQIERLEQRLSGKSQRRTDQVFTFEEMGVDFLFVDEAHLFRKLDFATKMSSVKGVSPEGSKSSWDLYVKTRYLETINPGRNLVLASGTPVTNTMAELFTVSRYLQPDVLKERGLEHFDAWAGAFGDTVSRIEQNAAGGYQSVTRFAKFVNVPELSVMVRQNMDVVTSKQLDDYVTRPKLKGGQRQMHLAEKDDALESYQAGLGVRMEAIEKRRGPPSKGDDIILSVINDGRHAAIDMRLVNPDLPSNPGSKLNMLVDNVFSIWEKTKRQPFHTPTAEGYKGKPVDKGPAAQLVFANLGLSGKRGFAVPDYIRAELVRRGVPKSQVAFIADFKTHVSKQRLFNDVNTGKVRILIGSTAKMATGVNVQKRLYASHNLDPLWYPADDEQRNGRSLRQGNMNPVIELHDYSTKGTYDSTMWGLMETKARFIQGFFEGDANLRDMEDLGEASQYEQAKALTTADPRLILLTELRQTLERALRRKKAFEREQYANRDRVARARDRESYYSARIPNIEKDIARRTDTAGDNFKATINGQVITERVEAGDTLLGQIDLMAGETREYKSHKIGAIGGFDIVADVWTLAKGKREAAVAISRAGNHETESRLSNSSVGVMRSLEFTLNSFEDELTNAQNRLEKARNDIREFQPQTGKGFTGQQEIDDLTTKVRNLERELAPEPEKPEESEESFDLTPEAAKKMPAAIDDLRKRLNQVGISDKIALKLSEVIRDKTDAIIPNARGKYYRRVIEVATYTKNKKWTLDHEIIHALKDLGVIRDAEWTSLKKAALADKPLMTMIRKRYKNRNLSEAKIFEEAIADMHANWSAGKFRAKGFVGRAFERIRDFLEALGSALRGQGFNSVGEIFRRVERGDVGRRLQPEVIELSFESSFTQGEDTDVQLSLEPGGFDPERARRAIKFDNEESEARWQEARKGIKGGESVVSRASQWLEHIANGFARHYQHLPNEPKFSDAREQLRKVEAAPQASKEEAVRTLRRIVADMDATDVDLFTRKVVLDDLSFEVDQMHQLPFGLTPATVRSELAKVNAALRPELKERVRLRNRLISSVADEMVRSGVLSRAQIKNPAYYRHQVLDYARAQVQHAKTPGKRLKSPHWARRMGSNLDINANLLEAEFEWLQKALTDVAVADTIEWFKASEYNIRGDVLASARASNDRLIQRMIAKDMRDNGFTKNGRQTSPINEEWVQFKQRIAVGLQQISGVIESEEMDIPPEFEHVAASLIGESTDTSIFPFLSWILDNNQPASMGAAMVFKAVNQRKMWIQHHLGDQYADPLDIDGLIKRGFAPEGYTSWQPEEGRLLFTAKTIPEHVVDRMLDRISEEDSGPISAAEMRSALQSVRSLIAVGGPKYQMVIPIELADTLNSLRDEHGDTLIDAVFAKPLMQWKRWVLINPRRVLKYNLNNLSGDADAVIAGNPRALKKVPKAIKELWQVMIKGQEPSRRYREAVDRGVFDSGLTIQEIPDINYMSEFENLINPPKPVRNPVRYVGQKLLDVWRAVQNFTWFRENWLRYAAYLDYVERLEAGEDMRSIGYGAANREMVQAVSDNKDRAALLARELVGDYGAISHFGSHIRRKLIPFYSWMEINTKRYWRLGINAWDQGAAQGFRTSGMIGATLGLRTSVWLTLRMAVLYGMVQAWNILVMGDEHDELSAEERVRLHIILGRDKDDNVRTLRFQGALSDFLGWIGFEDAVATAIEIEKGRADYGELMETIAKAPVNRVGNGLTPLISAPVEAMSGKKFWPDVFRPRQIRDKWRNLAQLFSVEHEYDLIFDKPSRGYGASIEQIATYKRNLDESAYNRVKGMTYDWLRREKGLQGGGSYITPRSQALYEYRKAKRFGDRDAAKKAYGKLRDLGVSGKDLQASIRRAHPLGSVPIRDRKAFLATLTTKERELLDQAIAWYKETYVD